MNNQDSPNGGSYRAAQGNLNAVISNPSVNINDTMNMNIQNMNSTSNNNQVNLNTISNNDVSKINNRSQVFLCTSIEEGFGLPGLEAMACGCAVVSTAYEGIFEYAIDRENALLSPIKDVDAMINNVIMLFENDELRKKIVDNGMKTAKERSFKKAADEFENIIIKK